MPAYDFVCSRCERRQERFVRLEHFDHAQQCEFCGGLLVWQMPAPGLGLRVAGENGRIYEQHNITRRTVSPGGTVIAEPNPESQQCQCGNCAAHRLANRVTGVAEPGKAR